MSLFSFSLLQNIYVSLEKNYTYLDSSNTNFLNQETASCVLFFTLSDGNRSAVIIRAEADNLISAYQLGYELVKAKVKELKLNVEYLRIDWPEQIIAIHQHQLEQLLSEVPSNHFRYGLALDKQLNHVFLEQEINSKALFYAEGKTTSAINIKNFISYTQQKFGQEFNLPFINQNFEPGLEQKIATSQDILEAIENPVYIFVQAGLFVNLNTQDKDKPVIHSIIKPELINLANRLFNEKENLLTQDTIPTEEILAAITNVNSLNSGHRCLDSLSKDDIEQQLYSNTYFLARQTQLTGYFNQGYFASSGNKLPIYSSLSHTKPLYSLLKAYETLPNNKNLLVPIKRALQFLTNKLIVKSNPSLNLANNSAIRAFHLDPLSKQINLGETSLSLLCLIKYEQLTADTRYRELMQQLALGIQYFQQDASIKQEIDTQELNISDSSPTKQLSKFVYRLNEDLSHKASPLAVEQAGQAVFSLICFYELTQDEESLIAAQQAIDYFIEAKYWQHSNAWLTASINKIINYLPKEEYFDFGIQSIQGSLNRIEQSREFSTNLLNLAINFHQLIFIIKDKQPEIQQLLYGIDLDKFYIALNSRVKRQLHSYFWPEQAIYFANPNLIFGSVYAREQAFKASIDATSEHLLGYINYYQSIKLEEEYPLVATQSLKLFALPLANEKSAIILSDIRISNRIAQTNNANSITIKYLLGLEDKEEFNYKFVIRLANINAKPLDIRSFIQLAKHCIRTQNYDAYLLLAKYYNINYPNIDFYRVGYHHAKLVAAIEEGSLDYASEQLNLINLIIESTEIKPFFSTRYLQKRIEINKILEQPEPLNNLILAIRFSNRRRIHTEDILGIAEYIYLAHPKNKLLVEIADLLTDIENATQFIDRPLHLESVAKIELYTTAVNKLAYLIKYTSLINSWLPAQASWLPSQAWMVLSILCASKLYINEYYILRTLAREQALQEKNLITYHLAQYIRAKCELQQSIDTEDINKLLSIKYPVDEDTYNFYQSPIVSATYKEMIYLSYLYFGEQDLCIQGFSSLDVYNHSFLNYIKNKSVAIVGPVDIELDNGAEIDSYDIVVRFNYKGLDGYCPTKFGTKTNISNYIRQDLISNHQDEVDNIYINSSDLDWFFYEIVSSDQVIKELDLENKSKSLNTVEIYNTRLSTSSNNIFFRSTPNAIQSMLIFLLQYPIKKIKVFNSDLFLTEKYHANYTRNSLKSTHFLSHDITSNFIYTKILWKQGLIEADEVLAKVLSMTEEEYIIAMNERYGAEF